MTKMTDIHPLIEADRIFNKTYRNISKMHLDEDAVIVVEKMFGFSRSLDTFFCKYLPLDILFDDAPTPNPMLVEADKTDFTIRKVCERFEDLMKELNRSAAIFPSSFDRNISEVQAVLYQFKKDNGACEE